MFLFRRRHILGFLTVFIFIIALAFTFFEIIKVNEQSTSMMPTLYPGDYILFFRYPKNINRFEIVSAVDAGNGNKIVKKVLGLPGEIVYIIGGCVYINGVLLEEAGLPFVYKDTGRSVEPIWKIRLGEDSFILLGDNRNFSRDSRDFGAVHRSYIDELAVAIVWPLSRARWLK